MPYSIALLLGIAVTNFSVMFLLISIGTASLMSAWVKSIILIGLITLYSSIILKHHHLDRHFVTTLSALLASQSLVVTLFGLPYILVYLFLLDTGSNFVYYFGLTLDWILLLLGSTWLFAIFSRIYQEALAVSLNKALFATLILMIVITLVFILIRMLGF
jgi:hypothetical protein